MADATTLGTGTSFAKVYRMLRLDRRDISSIYVFAIMAGIVQLSLPLGIQTTINFVMAGSFSTSIAVLILLVVFGTFANGLLQIRQLEIIERLKQKLFVRFGLEFSERIPKLDADKHHQFYLPELVNRFFDVVSLQKGLEKLLLDLPAAVIQIVLGLLLLTFYHPVFIAFGLLLLVIVAFILYVTSAKGFALALQSSDYKYQLAAWLQETARLTKSFRYANSDFHIRKTDELIGSHLDARTAYFRVLLGQFWSLVSFKVIITAAMLVVGTILLVNQQINVGQFIASDIVIIAIIGSVEKLILSLDKVYEALVSVEKLGTITGADLERGGDLDLGDPGHGVAIRFLNTGFSYPDGRRVLEQLNFDIPPDAMIRLAGKSGSGKSTILKLLTGAYRNFEGNILIDGEPLLNFNLQSLRRRCGVLLDNQEIFQGTLLDNITMGKPGIGPPEIQDGIERMQLAGFVQSSRHGLYMMLSPMGRGLAKEVKKKILLLRAMVGQHRLLLLEDPFEDLDKPAAELLFRWLKSLTGTTMVVASDSPLFASEYDAVIALPAEPLA